MALRTILRLALKITSASVEGSSIVIDCPNCYSEQQRFSVSEAILEFHLFGLIRVMKSSQITAVCEHCQKSLKANTSLEKIEGQSSKQIKRRFTSNVSFICKFFIVTAMFASLFPFFYFGPIYNLFIFMFVMMKTSRWRSASLVSLIFSIIWTALHLVMAFIHDSPA